MKTIKPHDYQESAIQATRECIRNGKKRVVIVAPTGAGKTTIAAEIIHSAVEKGSPVLFLAHRKELIDQASARLSLYGIEHGVIKAGVKPNPDALVQVASIQTLLRRSAPKAAIVIVDEAHRAKAKGYLKQLEKYPDAVVLGLTATPWRLDGSGLGDIFEELVLVCQPGDLIDRDPPVLVRPRVFTPDSPNLKGVKVVNGDYEQAAIEALMATKASVSEITRNWTEKAAGRQTVCFATSIKHSLMIRDAFRELGVSAEHVDGETPMAEREGILADFAAGRVQVVTNCAILVEGWDCPQASCLVLARPTKSLTIFLQAVGRVLRVAPGKTDAIVLDHSGNHDYHGFATEPRPWTLKGREKKPGAAPVKTCLNCYACVPSLAKVCPECGEKFPPSERANAPQEDRDLVERQEPKRSPGAPRFDGRDSWLARYWRKPEQRDIEYKQHLYEVLAEHCLRWAYKPGWIRHKYQLLTDQQPSGAVMYASRYADRLDALKPEWVKP